MMAGQHAMQARRSVDSWPGAGGRAGPRGQPCLLVEESECLLNEGGMVLEDAAMPGVRENAQLCIRQPAG
jgi:hypothetical protein